MRAPSILRMSPIAPPEVDRGQCSALGSGALRGHEPVWIHQGNHTPGRHILYRVSFQLPVKRRGDLKEKGREMEGRGQGKRGMQKRRKREEEKEGEGRKEEEVGEEEKGGRREGEGKEEADGEEEQEEEKKEEWEVTGPF